VSDVADHWLVEFARKAPLGDVLDPIETRVAHMFIGAIKGTACGLVSKPKVSDFRRLVLAEEAAQEVIRARIGATAPTKGGTAS